jgi:predicted nucleic acid-binding protein
VILLDSNILIDLIELDPVWYDWSAQQVAVASSSGNLCINDIVVAEVAPSMGSLDVFAQFIASIGVAIEPLTSEAAYLAGLAFLAYRRNRQGSKSIIADFMIGGHAQHIGASILTRDSRFYRAYFPSVPLISPEIAV